MTLGLSSFQTSATHLRVLSFSWFVSLLHEPPHFPHSFDLCAPTPFSLVVLVLGHQYRLDNSMLCLTEGKVLKATLKHMGRKERHGLAMRG